MTRYQVPKEDTVLSEYIFLPPLATLTFNLQIFIYGLLFAKAL